MAVSADSIVYIKELKPICELCKNHPTEEIANHIGVSVSLFDKVMMGILQVTPNIQRKLCELTGYDIGDLCIYDRTRESRKDTDKESRHP